MEATNDNMNNYWKSLDEFNGLQSESHADQFQEISALDLLADEHSNGKTSRRDFLKWCGFSVLAATVVSGCENPVKKAIPYLNKPEEVTPGMPTYYASNFFDGKDYCSIIVNTREGRPIKIEGNPASMLSGGGTHARIQASVLSLYDTAGRYHYPSKKGKKTTWDKADTEIIAKLKEINGSIVLLTNTVISPSTREVLRLFCEKYPNARHIMYDPVSYRAMRMANAQCFNRQMIPMYRFDKASLIIGFYADFLGNWLLPVTFAQQYSETRRIGADKNYMSLHLQFESGMSLTGANADHRFMITPDEEFVILRDTYRIFSGASAANAHNHAIKLVELIRNNTGKTLLVSGTNKAEIQVLVNGINFLAGSYGNTIDFSNSINLYNGDEGKLLKLIGEMESGQAGAVITFGANPVYDFPDSRFAAALEKVPLKISLDSALNETSGLAEYILPSNHYLESWDDNMPAEGFYGITQPVIRPLYDTRQMQDTLLKWAGIEKNYQEFLKEFCAKQIYPVSLRNPASTIKAPDSESFWTKCLQTGSFVFATDAVFITSINQEAISAALIANRDEPASWYLQIYESTSLGDGRHANNPWLQELPDPVTKVCWDNYASISPADAEKLGLANGDKIKVAGKVILPVFIQPGQQPGIISVAMGYGRKLAGKVAERVGVNVFQLALIDKGLITYAAPVEIEKVTGRHELAQTQSQHDMKGRAIVRESVLEKWKVNPEAGNELHKQIEKHHVTLYPEPEFPAHHWALAVDLNRCTGCSNCVIACQAENNIPVIGKKEVMRRRIMHWMRIDRYYNGSPDNPGVVFQPLMCQHCDNAPCENVCPVAATTHSDEGINQITYNRCVGTKYCINNCPYKVRRFNWFEYARNKAFDYHMNDDLGRLVLNPDVTVRERGVVEKCSFCIQRIQAAKLKAKTENRMMGDGEVIPACVQSCPAKALVFGDLKDPESQISKLFADKRNYHLLEELHTLPSVGYLTKIRNKSENL